MKKNIKPLLLENVPTEKLPLELAGIQCVDISSGVQKTLPAILRSLGIGETVVPNVLDNPFARDGHLLEVIAEQLRYAKTFTDSLNLVHMLRNIGMKCSETDRAREIFENMASLSLFSIQGGVRRIDYEKVRLYLLYEWSKQIEDRTKWWRGMRIPPAAFSGKALGAPLTTGCSSF